MFCILCAENLNYVKITNYLALFKLDSEEACKFTLTMQVLDESRDGSLRLNRQLAVDGPLSISIRPLQPSPQYYSIILFYVQLSLELSEPSQL